MNRLLAAIWLGLLLLGCQEQEESLRVELAGRLRLIANDAYIPPICLDTLLPAHSRFIQDTIWLNPVDKSFQTLDDQLSLVYHEYQHFLMLRENAFPVALDSLGFPVQWRTDSMISYQATITQVERDWRLSLEDWPSADTLQRKALWETLAAPTRYPFRYAPSNLALEEIEAYQRQLAGIDRGFYVLSPQAHRSILIRLHQLEHTLKTRLDWEAKHQLNPDGTQAE